jgi:FkbM family methyltransferase
MIMKIELNVLNSTPIDLSLCDEFISYYTNGSSYTKHIIEKEINSGHYNDPDFLKIFENNDAVVIDGGTNIGLFSLFLNKACKKIYAVEPTTSHLNVLRKLTQLLEIKNIRFSEVAFNNYNGQCTFMVDSSNTTTNRIASYGTSVNCVKIIDYIKATEESQIDLLKLDIEGGEQFAVLGDPSFVEVAEMCKNIYIELHPSPGVNPIDVISKFTGMGYKIKFMNSEFLNNNLNVLAYK